ncbi:magnesium transporter CorA [Serinibacter arcticus]|uniref:Magnesium transporter CorA n=2 Tax=Serinibacter arcticus TaxID=1655435 RepID=A0A2U1ZZ83_9MICO|nr:magnesium transporter CorA [Serinibacter arcticus]
MAGDGDAALRQMADSVLAPHASAGLPDDTVAMRVALLSLSEGDRPVRSTLVHVVAQLDRAVTTSVDRAALERLVARVRSLPASRRRGNYVVVRALLSLALEDVTAVSDGVTSRTARLENAVFSTATDDDDNVAGIYRVKRAIADSRRHVLPILTRLTLITEVDDADLGEVTLGHLERLEQGFRRVADALDTDDRLLGDMLTAQLTMVQVRQNTDMRRISAYAALAAVPTAVAGIYGMNFEYMPELTWHWGYPAVMTLIAGAVAVLYRAFKRSGWL